MASGTTSVQHGRIPLDHGNCTKMARFRLLVKGLKEVEFNYPLSNMATEQEKHFFNSVSVKHISQNNFYTFTHRSRNPWRWSTGAGSGARFSRRNL